MNNTNFYNDNTLLQNSHTYILYNNTTYNNINYNINDNVTYLSQRSLYIATVSLLLVFLCSFF